MTPGDIERCFCQYRACVYRWALALCARHDQALDAVQEVFLRLLRSRPELNGPEATRAWLRQTTLNVVLDRWRSERARRRRERLPRLVERTTPPDEQEQIESVQAALAGLSTRQRAVLVGRFYDQMTFAQIARELGISPSSAMTYCVRGLRAISERLARDRAGPDDPQRTRSRCTTALARPSSPRRNP